LSVTEESALSIEEMSPALMAEKLRAVMFSPIDSLLLAPTWKVKVPVITSSPLNLVLVLIRESSAVS